MTTQATGSPSLNGQRISADRQPFDQEGSDLLVDATEAAAALWRRHARCTTTYLKQRGLRDAAADPASFGLGYAPLQWRHLIGELRGRGLTDATLEAAGLAVRTNNAHLIDRFRGRLMFPIRDPHSGRVVGAIGRDLTNHPGVPKYLNSPTSTIYRKGELLYGLAEQRARIAAGAIPTIVEGPLDALAIQQCDPRLAPVAPCGSALTSTHVAELRRNSRGGTVVLAFDGDTAGGIATSRAVPLCRAEFDTVLCLPLRPHEDPTDALARPSTARLQLEQCWDIGQATDEIANARQH